MKNLTKTNTVEKKKISLWSRLKNLKKHYNDSYSKRMLTRIIDCSLIMMFLSYVLAWYDKTYIAETLSSTIAQVIIGVTIPYLISKTLENINKYGSKLNGTSEGQIPSMSVPTPPVQEPVFSTDVDSDITNEFRDC